ncbi:BlaI/MecI/CopY family transcriptional regulator [Clostridium sp. C2-6-12]|uniref:BlaI/MecI/CopY family transcriptional regulator n=1 Tax=Clostridium sp. C2-6-12 TaxID=2698832 RepID=UPI001FAC60A8|nr:BlaI/MecI/CopY family transcriptional regulator [Clostridium sp. C2-6-12]
MMDEFKKIPEAELEVMKIIWNNETPISTSRIKEICKEEKKNSWTVSTLQTLLNRLIERGFLNTEKRGKERIYSPKIMEEEYLEFETKMFLKKVHGNSFPSLINTLYRSKEINKNDIEELYKWFKKE